MSFSRVSFIAGSIAALFAVVGLTGCSSADASKEAVSSDESELRLASPKYLGQIASGETKTVQYSDPPHYRAYGFTAKGGDEITADVKSVDGDGMGWITTSAFDVLAANDDASSSTLDAKVVYKVPAGTASRAYRIVFRDYDLLDATFNVKLTVKTAAPPPPPPPPACDPDSEWWRDYVGTPTQCTTLRYSCHNGQVSFQNACGCGCQDPTH